MQIKTVKSSIIHSLSYQTLQSEVMTSFSGALSMPRSHSRTILMGLGCVEHVV